jgi:hypothetical protein
VTHSFLARSSIRDTAAVCEEAHFSPLFGDILRWLTKDALLRNYFVPHGPGFADEKDRAIHWQIVTSDMPTVLGATSETGNRAELSNRTMMIFLDIWPTQCCIGKRKDDPMIPTAKHSPRCLLATVLAAFISAVLCLPTVAQTTVTPSDPNVDTGTHWYGTYDGVHENISMSSGNLSFCIPLVSLKGPNKHDLSVPLCYNSQFLEAYTLGGTPGVAPAIGYFPWVWASNTPSGYTTPVMGPGWALSGAPAYYAAPGTSPSGSPVEFMPDGAKYTIPSGSGPDAQSATCTQ